MRKIDEITIRKAIATIAIERLLDTVPQSDLLPALNLVSMQDLSKMMDLNYSTMRGHVKRGRIPRPTVQLNRRPYYTKQEAEAIAEVWKEGNSSWRKSAK